MGCHLVTFGLCANTIQGAAKGLTVRVAWRAVFLGCKEGPRIQVANLGILQTGRRLL